MNVAQRPAVKAEAKFRDAVAAFGGTVLGEYAGTRMPILVRCDQGHEFETWPTTMTASHRTQMPCRACSHVRQGQRTAEAFHARMAELGATVVGEYRGEGRPVAAICRNGHECSPRPGNTIQGLGICRTCVNRDPVKAEADFRKRVEEAGGEVLGEYHRSTRPVLIRCGQGHLSEPSPNNIQQGWGICRFCVGQVWNVFYVVEGPAGVKFGISSGNGKARLRAHEKDGYTEVLRLFTDLPDGVARSLENEIKRVLRAAGLIPVRGIEYFGPEACGLVLPVVDAWLK